MANLDKLMHALRDGAIDFGAYVAQTRREYGSMARYLLRRWRVPEWVNEHDVEQELYLETWRMVVDGGCSWESGRGPTLARWVVFGAMSAAKRKLHRARGVSVSGNPDRLPSPRHERPISHIEDSGESLLDTLHSTEPPADAALERAQETRRAATAALRACTTRAERYAVLAVREAGSVDGAAAVLYEDIDHRIALRLGDEVAADRFVRRRAAAVARRMMGA